MAESYTAIMVIYCLLYKPACVWNFWGPEEEIWHYNSWCSQGHPYVIFRDLSSFLCEFLAGSDFYTREGRNWGQFFVDFSGFWGVLWVKIGCYKMLPACVLRSRRDKASFGCKLRVTKLLRGTSGPKLDAIFGSLGFLQILQLYFLKLLQDDF